MTDVDDWRDPWDDVPAKEEPNCPPCGDFGYTGLPMRNCRSCNPTRLQHLWWRLTWRIRARLKWSFRRRVRSGNFDAEAPF